MFGLFRSARRKSPPARSSSFRPSLERLENRDCPSSITLAIAGYAANKEVIFSGQVSDMMNPVSNLRVNLTGAVNGWTTTDSTGHYSVQLLATALSTVYAATADGQSNTAQVTLTDNTAPQINSFTGSQHPGNVWEFTGTVTGEIYAGEVVNFSGMPVDMAGKSTTINAYGQFDFVVQLNGQMTDNGTVYAQTTDWWGLTSPYASWIVMQR